MSSRTKPPRRSASSRPLISLIVTLLVILIGVAQFLATVRTYTESLGQLNTLKAQEASLIAQKEDLENDIARWDDKAYVVSQARERLGFVFPGETSVLVSGTEDYGVKSQSSTAGEELSGDDLPWYKELQYSFQQADEVSKTRGEKFQNGS